MSPSLRSDTPGPTSVTTPTCSWPNRCQSVAHAFALWISVPHSPTRDIARRTSPGPGVGLGISSNRTQNGAFRKAAFIDNPPTLHHADVAEYLEQGYQNEIGFSILKLESASN